MARLKAADVEHFLERLRAPAAATSEPVAAAREPSAEDLIPESVSAPQTDDAGRSVLRSVAMGDADAVASALRSAMNSYLGRDVTLEIEPSAAPAETALCFESAGSADVWRMDIDAGVAAAIGDVAIGGTGTNIRHAKRARLGKQLEAFALQMMRAAAAQFGVEQPGGARYASNSSGEPAEEGATQLAGSLALGDAQGSLRVALVRTASPIVDNVAGAAASERPAHAREIVRPVVEPSQRAQPRIPAPLLEPARKQPSQGARDDAFEPAVGAATARLADTARCTAELETMDVERVDTPSLTRGDLKIALIAGGQGSLVLSADKQTVASVAAAVLGRDDSASDEVGAVGIDAVEAVLRASMRAFADRLPAIAGTPPRFVRLADGALPARSPHFEIVAPVRIAERPATLRWLVPAWMAGSRGDGRKD